MDRGVHLGPSAKKPPAPIAWSSATLLYERAAGAATAPLPSATYQRREPEQTALYEVVEAHLETVLAEARLRTEHGFGYPRVVEQTLRDYLACGRRELGFARVRCGACGFERLLAFSCKRRGLCPSCEGRRMADTAAHLVDRVLPAVPYRQWVLSLPIPIRLRLVREPALLAQTLRIFIRRISAWQRRIARGMGITDGRCAAVTFIQRAGGALNINPHFHTVAADGVFDVRPDGSVRFVPVLGPTDEEVAAICGQVSRRVLGLLPADDEPDADPPSDDILAPTLPLVLPPGRAGRPRPEWEHPRDRPNHSPRCSQVDGFSLHANTAVDALDRLGLERLCRYGLRSSFALSRLSLCDDGRLSYRLKRPWPDGRTELVLEPVELLRRLVHLIPPARAHLVRYHGAFAPASSIRAAIRPRQQLEPTAEVESCCATTRAAPTVELAEADASSTRPRESPAAEPKGDEPAMLDADTDLMRVDPERLLTSLGPHLDEQSLLPVRQRRLDWAALLRRVFEIDVLRCPRCAGRMKVLVAINDPEVAQKILRHLGLPADPPSCAPARAPPELFDDADFDTDPTD